MGGEFAQCAKTHPGLIGGANGRGVGGVGCQEPGYGIGHGELLTRH